MDNDLPDPSGPPAAPPRGPAPALPPPPEGVEFRAALLLVALLVLVCAAAAYLLYARGVFEATQRLVLIADDSEGVTVGMTLTFAGFPIGRVGRIELTDEGNARILVDVPRKDAHWLRSSSVFTLSRGLVGNTALRAYSGILTDPLLPDGAVRRVLAGDATTEIPRLVAAARDLVQNLIALTATDGPLAATLGNVQSVTEQLKGPGGALGVLMGNDVDRSRIVTALDRTNALLARIDGLVKRTDGLVGRADNLVGRADEQLLGASGVVSDTRATVAQLTGLLTEARGSLKKVDALLDEAQGIARNARVATTDLGLLRAEVESSLRKVEHLVSEINRKWPFARDTEVKLP
ncbi:MlaD family protein [Ideonella sp. A 288]|uniref:MlaD family protein n=1 Tax=Ideonella sp. A 288 TaxID=1962181 RepID=UPI000B4B1CEE|nr:MlaD family protein [Ideonella sp. A 288]